MYYSPVGESTSDLICDWASLQYQGVPTLEIGCSACYHIYIVYFLSVQAQCDSSGLCQYMLLLSFTAGMLVPVPVHP